jgi:hypothetical protein
MEFLALFTPPTMDNITLTVITVLAQTSSLFMLELADSPNDKRKKNTEKRSKTVSTSQRRIFNCDQALQAIGWDYLGLPEDPAIPLFAQEFKMKFRLSRPHFDLLVQDVMNRQIPLTSEAILATSWDNFSSVVGSPDPWLLPYILEELLSQGVARIVPRER